MAEEARIADMERRLREIEYRVAHLEYSVMGGGGRDVSTSLLARVDALETLTSGANPACEHAHTGGIVGHLIPLAEAKGDPAMSAGCEPPPRPSCPRCHRWLDVGCACPQEPTP